MIIQAVSSCSLFRLFLQILQIVPAGVTNTTFAYAVSPILSYRRPALIDSPMTVYDSIIQVVGHNILTSFYFHTSKKEINRSQFPLLIINHTPFSTLPDQPQAPCHHLLPWQSPGLPLISRSFFHYLPASPHPSNDSE